ncbi:MAG: hypothetical protein WD294_11945 [Phycisphaeraceae bacterium]
MLTRKQVLDRYYPEVRAWLLQIAAVMDRHDRAEDAEPTADDPRLKQYHEALKVLAEDKSDADRARMIQLIYSDPVGPPAES